MVPSSSEIDCPVLYQEKKQASNKLIVSHRLPLYMIITCNSKSKDRPGKVTNPARGELNRENYFTLSPFAPDNAFSRDGFGSPVPRQPANLHTQAESGAYLLRNSSRFPLRRPFFISTAIRL